MNDVETRRIRNRALSEAIRAGDARTVRQLVGMDKAILSVDWGGGRTWLHNAAEFNNPDVVAVLVEAGLDPNVRLSDEPQTPLHDAALKGNVEVVRWLVEHGAKVNVGGIDYPTPLSYAVSGNIEVVKFLTEMGADVNTCHDYPLRNPLFLAREKEKSDIESFLRQNGALFPWEIPEWKRAEEHGQEILEHLEKHLGRLNRLPRVSNDPVAIFVAPATELGGSVMLLTIGLNRFGKHELLFELPVDWPVDDDHLSNNQFGWPLEWLRLISERIIVDREQIDEGHTFSTGDHSEPLGPGVQMSALLLLRELCSFGHFNISDGIEIEYLSLFPIFEQELALKERIGVSALVEAFMRAGISTRFDRMRRSAV
ncbi:MAG: ankyrin repeat-containing protein [Pedosphaera sp.]|nr:ankyrin repeat-containing protein [Pedosphaera sp.]